MPQRLTKADYMNILNYYHKPVPKSMSALKKHAESIMSLKLCRCIKKIDPINESKSIGICTKTVINRKGLSRGAFTCKKKRKIILHKLSLKKR